MAVVFAVPHCAPTKGSGVAVFHDLLVSLHSLLETFIGVRQIAAVTAPPPEGSSLEGVVVGDAGDFGAEVKGCS
jgi:hypothetical protein